MNQQDIDAWAEAFVAYQSDPANDRQDHPLFWASERFMLADGPSPDDCWRAILAVLARRPSEQVLGMLAAGPLEDLIEYSGQDFIGRIEHEARVSPKFRWLLGGVWRSGEPEVWERVEAAREEAW